MVAGDPDHATWIGEVARTIDHDLRWLPDGAGTGHGAWLLAGAQGPGWTAVAVAARPASAVVLEVPRPRTERGSSRLAAEAWMVARGTALLVDPELTALRGGGQYLDPTVPGNVATAFQAAHQALYRGVAARAGAAVVQVRGFAAWRPAKEELVASIGMPLLDVRRAPTEIAALIAPEGALGRLAGTRRWVDGGADVADLAGNGSPQLLYANALIGPPFALVWFAESVRARTAPVGDPDDVRRRAARFGVELVERPLAEVLGEGLDAPARTFEPDKKLLALADEYAASGDVAALAELVARAPRGAVRLGWSPDLRLAYVVVELRRGREVVRAAALSAPAPGASCAPIEIGRSPSAIWEALQARCPRIVVHGGRER
jgi:hypothetical protein